MNAGFNFQASPSRRNTATPYLDQGRNKMSEKLISRDRISGCWVPNDIEPGEYSGDELRKRVADQQRQLNRAVLADWETANYTATSKTLAPARDGSLNERSVKRPSPSTTTRNKTMSASVRIGAG